jgi:hypothetical protein
VQRACEEANMQESARGDSRKVGRLSSERGQKAGEPRKWSQGRPGQKPQEENCRPAKTPGARGQGGAARRGERGDRLDSRPFRIPRYRLGLWRNPLFCPRTPLNPSSDGLSGKARAASSIVVSLSVRQANRAESPRLLPLVL